MHTYRKMFEDKNKGAVISHHLSYPLYLSFCGTTTRDTGMIPVCFPLYLVEKRKKRGGIFETD